MIERTSGVGESKTTRTCNTMNQSDSLALREYLQEGATFLEVCVHLHLTPSQAEIFSNMQYRAAACIKLERRLRV